MQLMTYFSQLHTRMIQNIHILNNNYALENMTLKG